MWVLGTVKPCLYSSQLCGFSLFSVRIGIVRVLLYQGYLSPSKPDGCLCENYDDDRPRHGNRKSDWCDLEFSAHWNADMWVMFRPKEPNWEEKIRISQILNLASSLKLKALVEDLISDSISLWDTDLIWPASQRHQVVLKIQINKTWEENTLIHTLHYATKDTTNCSGR